MPHDWIPARVYEKGLILTVDNLTLAHIVSCRECLDCANQELGLPLLAERYPADALDSDNSWRGGPGASGVTGGSSQVIRSHRRGKDVAHQIKRVLLRCQHRARELFEHHPRELCVSINGHLLGSQSVNSEMSRLRLRKSATWLRRKNCKRCIEGVETVECFRNDTGLQFLVVSTRCLIRRRAHRRLKQGS